MPRPGRRKAEAQTTPPQQPPVIELSIARSTPVLPPPPSRSPRFALPLILAVSASILAVSAYQYGRHSASPSQHTAARPPALSDATASASSPYPYTRLPVLLSSHPSPTSASLSSHPVLRHVAPYGLPALPYSAREGRYAYPLLVREGYVCQWNARTRNADWVIEVLNGSQPASSPPTPPTLERSASSSAVPTSVASSAATQLTSAPTRDLSTFRSDPLLSPSSLPPTPSLYLNSSYDRGHLVPAASAAATTQSAMDETFYLTNISPQHPNCNRGYWRAIEGWLRDTSRRWHSAYGPSAAVTVITGPLWLEDGGREGGGGASDSKDGSRRYVRYEVIPRSAPLVAVPTHFYKVLLATSERTSPLLAAFVVPNGPISATVPLQSFVSSVAAIESSTGWHFFPLLTRSSTTATATATATAERPANAIDVTELLLGESEIGRGRGLSELERASLLELCKDGGCELSNEWKKIELWDAVNRGKRKQGRRVSSTPSPTPLSANDTTRADNLSNNAGGVEDSSGGSTS